MQAGSTTTEVRKAVALALSYVEGLRANGGSAASDEVTAFLEHLAINGFLVRPRDGAERLRLARGALTARNISGAGIRATQEALGLSHASLATMAGIAPDTIRDWETERKSPHARKLTAVLDALARARTGAGEKLAGPDDALPCK